MTYQLKRSLLYSPASRIDRVEKALRAGQADVVVADLEDGTAPGDRSRARQELRRLLAAAPESRSALAVRINSWGTPEAQADLEAIRERPPRIVVLPKVEDAAAVAAAARSLAGLRTDLVLYVQVETARGLLAAASIAAGPRVEAIIFGAEDYAANVGAMRTPESLEVLYARSHVVAAAAAAGVDAIDQIWAAFKDEAGLERDARFGAQLGFAGKQLIHPDQIGPTHRAFAPAPSEVDRARRIVEAAEAAGGGVVVVDGRMIDRPLVEQARRVLRRATV